MNSPSTTHPAIKAKNIAQSPDFAIHSALLWIRTAPDRAVSLDGGRPSGQLLSQQFDSSITRRYTASDVPNSIAIDQSLPDLGLLQLHRDRLQTAAEALGWRYLDCFKTNARGLDVIRSRIQDHLDTLNSVPKHICEHRKLRISITNNGHLSVDSAVIKNTSSSAINQEPLFQPSSFDDYKYPSITPPSRIHIDTTPTKPSTFTTHKTSYRPFYDEARSRAQVTHSLPTSEDVLLFNPYGEVMETSVCTIYFQRNGEWITPAAICGGNLGVTRRLALESGLCKQGVIEVKDLQNGEEVWLSNAVRGFFKGVIVQPTQVQSPETQNTKAQFDAVDWAASPVRGGR